MRKEKFGVASLLVGIAVGLLLLGTTPAGAATITSSDFTFGIGYQGSVYFDSWNQTENASNNSPTTQGSFTFSPTATGAAWTYYGPTFPNRTLTDGGNEDACGYVGTSDFSVPITANYNGAAPADAAATPNYRLTVEITNIRIWIGDYGTGSTAGYMAQWAETTAGHEATSTLIDINGGENSRLVANYTDMAWNPDDYAVSLGSLNDSVTRTFGIPVRGDVDRRYGDGIEVFGKVILTYDNVPEPATLSLLLLGGIAMLRRRR